MEKIKQHYMLKIKRGESHPIFNLAYLPENIASLVVTPILIYEYILVTIFTFNIIIIIFEKYAMQFVPTLILNGFCIEIFEMFNVETNLLNNFIALVIAVLIYVATYRYLEYVKYNLHPKKIQKELLLNKKRVYTR